MTLPDAVSPSVCTFHLATLDESWAHVIDAQRSGHTPQCCRTETGRLSVQVETNKGQRDANKPAQPHATDFYFDSLCPGRPHKLHTRKADIPPFKSFPAAVSLARPDAHRIVYRKQVVFQSQRLSAVANTAMRYRKHAVRTFGSQD